MKACVVRKMFRKHILHRPRTINVDWYLLSSIGNEILAKASIRYWTTGGKNCRTKMAIILFPLNTDTLNGRSDRPFHSHSTILFCTVCRRMRKYSSDEHRERTTHPLRFWKPSEQKIHFLVGRSTLYSTIHWLWVRFLDVPPDSTREKQKAVQSISILNESALTNTIYLYP
jgi:hypothetical protein